MLNGMADIGTGQMQPKIVKIEQHVRQSSDDVVQIRPRLLSRHFVACHRTPTHG